MSENATEATPMQRLAPPGTERPSIVKSANYRVANTGEANIEIPWVEGLSKDRDKRTLGTHLDRKFVKQGTAKSHERIYKGEIVERLLNHPVFAALVSSGRLHVTRGGLVTV